MTNHGRKLRVAYLGIKGLPARGGAERVVEAIVKRMPALGIEPIVYCGTRYTAHGTKIDGVKLVRLPTVPGKYTQQTVLDLLQALHAVFFGHYDLIHLHHNEAGFVIPLLRLRYKVVATSHGWRNMRKWGRVASFVMRLMDWPFMKLSNVVVYPSSYGAREMGRRFGREALYIPNGVSMDHAPNLEAARGIQAECGVSAGRYMILAAGRILPEKGVDLAIDAVNRHLGNTPLVIVGDDSGDPAYGRRLREMAGPLIRFYPLINDPGVLFGLMVDSRCMVFPSLVETMSMVLLEAASLGVPVISSDIPDNTAVMIDDAVYFRSGDAASLAEKIKWTEDHYEEFREIGLRARGRIHVEHSWDTIAAQYAEVYSELCKGKSSR